MRISRAIALLVLVLVAGVWSAPPLLASSGGAVRLVPGDRIAVTVFGQADLSGVFQVDGEGNIELPLIGAVAVGQLTVKECEKRIETRLADGYIHRPSVSVRINEVRPIYVLGNVKAPGAFPFRHGSSVLSAVAQAGGYGGAEPAAAAGALADFLMADERARTLESTRRLLLIRRARLEAQRDGRTTFEAPSLAAPAEQEQQVAAAVANEGEALRSQAEALEQELELLRKQKPRLETAYEAIEKQIEAEKRQFELVQGQLNDMAKLQSMGLSRRTTEVALQREQASLDSNMSRYRSELARLAVTIGDFDLKIHDTQHAYNRRVFGELQEVRSKLQEIDTALPSAREVREVRLQQSGNAVALDQARPMHRIVVSRTVGNEVKSLTVTEEALLEPGDIVEVRRLRSQNGANGYGLGSPREEARRESAAAGGALARQRAD